MRSERSDAESISSPSGVVNLDLLSQRRGLVDSHQPFLPGDPTYGTFVVPLTTTVNASSQRRIRRPLPGQGEPEREVDSRMRQIISDTQK